MSVTITPYLIDWPSALAAWQESGDEFIEALIDGDWADPEPEDWNDNGHAMVEAHDRLERALTSLGEAERSPFRQVFPLLFDSPDVHDLAADGEVPQSLSPERCAAWSALLATADWKRLGVAAAKLNADDDDWFSDPDDFIAYLGQWRALLDEAARSRRGLVITAD